MTFVGPGAIAAIRSACAGSDIQVRVVPTKYPSGGEKQLIQLLTGKEVPSGAIPAQCGVVCQNVGTAWAIKRAVHDGEPLIRRVTTVTGDAVARPGNYETLLGTPVRDLLRHAGVDGWRDARHRRRWGDAENHGWYGDAICSANRRARRHAIERSFDARAVSADAFSTGNRRAQPTADG